MFARENKIASWSLGIALAALFIGGMYGTAVGGFYFVAKQAQVARLEGRGGRRPQQYVRHQQQQQWHYD